MLRVAVVGCGVITTRKYIPILKRLHHQASIVGICDVNEKALAEAASRFGIRNTFANLSQLLTEVRPEVVVVCTPPRTHAELVIKALEYRSHVLVEKPMALTPGECREMVDAANGNGRRLGVMHNQVFNPAFERACSMVAAGKIGKFLGMRIFLMTPVEDMTTNRSHWAHRLPGGVVGETGPHAVYLSLALLDKVIDVQVCTKKLLPEFPWSAAEDVRFDLIANNGISSVTLIYGSNQAAAEVEIIGTGGMLKVDLQSRILVKHNRTVGPELLSANAVVRSLVSAIYQTSLGLIRNGFQHAWAKTLDGHYIGINRFLDHVADGAEYRATGEIATEVAEVLEVVIRKLQELQGPMAGQRRP